MATHSSIVAWRIPWTEEPCGFQSRVTTSWPWLKWLSMHAQELMSYQGLILNLPTPVGIAFLVSGSICVFLFSTWVCAQDTRAATLLYLYPMGRAQGPSATAQEGCIQATCPAAAARRDQLVVGNWKWKLTLPHFFSMWEKPCFYQVLDCVVFSLETPIPIFSWEKCLYFYSRW